MKLSIIIPVYNQERYIKKCIQSCLNQGLDTKDYEIIVVNDASTDRSLEIVRSFMNKFSQIRLVDKSENEGIEKARYSGYNIATGEFIAYIDSDDWLEPKILSKAIDTIEKMNVDYVEFGSYRALRTWIKRKSNQSSIYIEQPRLFEDYYLSFFGKNILSVSMWAKVYRKSVIDSANITPEGITMGEDEAFNLKLFPLLQSIYIMPDIGYNYRWGGMTSKFNPHLWPDLKQLYLLRLKKIEEYDYQKARRFLDIELRNVFRTEITQRIEYQIENRQATIDFIKQELSEDIWNDSQLRKNITTEDSFVSALLEYDASKVYDIIYSQVQKQKPKRFFKRIILTFLSK